MRSEIKAIDSVYCTVYDDDGILYHEYACCITPTGAWWYKEAKSFSDKEELKEFLKKGSNLMFCIATPVNGIVKTNGEVQPWFTPWQEETYPPYAGIDCIEPAMDPIFDHKMTIDKRSILFGKWDQSLKTFFFDPEEKDTQQLLFIFQNTEITPKFQEFVDKVDGIQFVNPRVREDNVVGIDVFIIADALKAQTEIGLKGNRISKRLSDGIRAYEKHNALVASRDAGQELTGEAAIKEVQKTLDRLKELDERICEINPKYGFAVEYNDRWFAINGRRYKYTTGANGNLLTILKIAKDEQLEKLVPQALLQRRKQMETCIMHLVRYATR